MTELLLYASCAALILLVVRDLKPEYAALGGVFVAITLGCASVKAFADVLSKLDTFSRYGIGEYVSVMLKVAGVCVCVDVCSDLCAQCGYASVAKAVLVYGRAQLLLIVLPYAERLLASVSALF